jgi:formate dehydrogenase maturation protein FdhE
LAVLESFSKNQSMSNLLAMSNEIIVDDLLLKVLVFLQKIKEKNKVGQQILLVKNFNSLEEKEDQKNIANLLQNDISNSSTCRVVIFS